MKNESETISWADELRQAPEWVRSIHTSYEIYRETYLNLRHEVEGDGGNANRAARSEMRKALYDFVTSVDPTTLPEAVAIRKPYKGKSMFVAAGPIAMDVSPSRTGKYYLPRTHEIYIVPRDGPFGIQFIEENHPNFFPENGKFMGVEQIRKLNAEGKIFPCTIYGLKLQTEQMAEEGIEWAGDISEGDVERILTAMKESVKDPITAKALAETQKLVEAADLKRARSMAEFKRVQIPLLKRRTENLAKVMEENLHSEGLAWPRAIYLNEVYDREKKDYVSLRFYYLTDSKELVKVPVVESRLFFVIPTKKLDFVNVIIASDEEWLQVEWLGDRFLDVLPEKYRKAVELSGV